MKALLLDSVNKEVKEVNPQGLEDYYDMIGCKCIDIVTRSIGKKWYEIICDDEGLLTNDPIISAIDNFGQVMLVGNLIICGPVDGEGELTDLSDNDIKYIKKRIMTLDTRLHEDVLMLTQCGY